MHRDIGLRRCPEKMSSLGGPTFKKKKKKKKFLKVNFILCIASFCDLNVFKMLTDVCKKHEYIIIKSWAKYLKCSISIQTNITIKNILFCPPLLYSHEVIVFKIYLNGFKIQPHPPHPSSKPGRLLAWAPNLEHQVCILQERQYCNITFMLSYCLPSATVFTSDLLALQQGHFAALP